MMIHDRAWSGIKIVILGKKPMLPMQLEQQIATHSPFLEVQLSSFENYDDAYKLCKSNKDVGFVILTEECGDAPFQAVFRELSKPYESRGLPCFGVILYENEPIPFSAIAVGKHQRLLDYLSVGALLSEESSSFTLEKLWEKYVDTFEAVVLPKPLESLLTSQAESFIGTQNLHFQMRLITILSSKLNLSWLDSAALHLRPILSAISKHNISLLEKQVALQVLNDLADPTPILGTDIIDVLKKPIEIAKKVSFLVEHLSKCRNNGILSSELLRISSHFKPGAAALIKYIHSNQEAILALGRDADSAVASLGSK